MDKNGNSIWDLPTDALVEILVRVPANSRRRSRLVCKHWRELIDQRTATDMRSRTKMIAVPEKGFPSVVIDVLTPGGPSNLWQRIDIDTALRYHQMSIISTCNGLVCLCDDLMPGGAITVANPSTGEALRVPPLPMPSGHNNIGISSMISWHHQKYSFAYHRTTTMGQRYKVVHVPGFFDRFWQPEIVHVFTLGDTAWRDVRAETDARSSLRSSSLTDLDGTVYWLTEESGKIMSFDLTHERITCTEPLPVPLPSIPITYCIRKVHGRLGVLVGDNAGDSVTVWVLEGDRWNRRYVMEASGPWRQEKWMMRPRRELAGPHLVHGNYFLTLARESPNKPLVLYRHTLSEAVTRSQDGVVRITHEDEGVTRLYDSIYRTFVYVETKEPLSVYNAILLRR